MPRYQRGESLRLLYPGIRLHIGLDVGKKEHTAAFITPEFINKYGDYTKCPTFTFQSDRAGFDQFLKIITSIVPTEHCYLLLENTGPYGKPLEQFIIDAGLHLYRIHPRKREGMVKSDKRDSLNLGYTLYSQLELGVQVADKKNKVRKVVLSSEAISTLVAFVSRRESLVRNMTRIKNQLTAINDELFPELIKIYKDPNCKTALALRKKFPAPKDILSATIKEFPTTGRGYSFPTRKFIDLQELARQSVGVKSEAQCNSLIILQDQYIDDLILHQEHEAVLDRIISETVVTLREGKILLSVPGIGLIQAASILATIGNVKDFPTAAAFKSYCGFAPKIAQSGSSMNKTVPAHSGNRTAKRMILFAAWRVIQQKDSEFAKLYQELVPKKCVYDEQTRSYKGRMKVVVRIAQRLLNVIYALLMQDQVLLQSNPNPLPEPKLYDPTIHHHHRHGGYQCTWPQP